MIHEEKIKWEGGGLERINPKNRLNQGRWKKNKELLEEDPEDMLTFCGSPFQRKGRENSKCRLNQYKNKRFAA